ncbi:hypothetical protein VTI74DRAFT_9333 [Chaetomium olivicolor]
MGDDKQEDADDDHRPRTSWSCGQDHTSGLGRMGSGSISVRKGKPMRMQRRNPRPRPRIRALRTEGEAMDEEEGEEDDDFEDFSDAYDFEMEDYELFINDPLEVLFERNKPDDIDAEEARVIATLIRRILKYDASERPSAEELLREKWFEDDA